MLYWLLVMIIFLLILAGCQYGLSWLGHHNVKINRWIWAAASFLILIVPHVLWKAVPANVDIILYGLCAIFAVNFFIEQYAHVQQMNAQHKF